jgi:hypothetical protein
MNIQKQNREIGLQLMLMNYDLKARENPEIQVSLLEVLMYVIVGGFAFIIVMGILRALLCRS